MRKLEFAGPDRRIHSFYLFTYSLYVLTHGTYVHTVQYKTLPVSSTYYVLLERVEILRDPFFSTLTGTPVETDFTSHKNTIPSKLVVCLQRVAATIRLYIDTSVLALSIPTYDASPFTKSDESDVRCSSLVQ